MSRATKCLKDYLEKISQGDLSVEMDPSLVSKGNDLGQIAHLAKLIQQNMKESATNLDKIANGNFDVKLSNTSRNNTLSESVENVAKKLSGFYGEITCVCEGVTEGKTELRIETSKFSGSYDKMLQDINSGFEALINTITEIEKALGMLAENDFTYRITKEFKGNFKKPVTYLNDLSERLDALAGSVAKISEGDTSDIEKYRKIGRRSENDNITPSMLAITQSIENMANETERLSSDAAEGKIIGNSIDSSAFNGKYKSIIDGLNGTLDSISTPIQDLNNVLSNLSVNDYTHDMSDAYKGDFSNISSAMSTVSARLRYLQQTAIEVSQGNISQLENLKKIGKRSENDKLMPAFILMMESIQKLIVQANDLASAAADGNFDYHCDVDQFEGEYKAIISTFEKMFGGIAGYIREEANVLNTMSNGKFHLRMGNGYKGQLGKLSSDINLTATNLGTVTAEISEALNQISDGNLAIDNLRTYKGDFSTISDAINQILSNLNEIIGSISVASEQVASGSSQVSIGSQNLSQGAAEQASSVEELTASISEVAAQTKANAEDATKASTLEAAVKDDAQAGKSQMDEMLKAMNDLKTSSSKISKIIKTIDDIAFQTNILALNAAVEAARAGQAGKGFAVVADEVRNLAAKSAKASSETTALIEETINKVNYGNDITGKTATALNNIAEGIGKVESLIGKIAVASNEQATGLSQIDTGIMQVSQVVQTNSATAEESAAASEELTGQADLLKNKVASIKLKNTSLNTARAYSESTSDKPKSEQAPVKISLGKEDFGKY